MAAPHDADGRQDVSAAVCTRPPHWRRRVIQGGMSERAAVHAFGLPRFHRLLAVIDGSNHSVVIAAAATMALREKARLTLISVAPRLPATAGWGATAISTNRFQDAADGATHQLLREAAERLPDDVSATTLFRRGKASAEILAEIRRGDYDALLISTRGRGRRQVLNGPLSRHAMRRLNIAVILVHGSTQVRGLRGLCM